MANNITQIPAARVPLVDTSSGLVNRDWYRFLSNLYTLSGQGSNAITLDDLQISPPTVYLDEAVSGAGGSGSFTSISLTSSSGTVTILPDSATATWTWTLPTNVGTANYVLQTDGAGNTSWVAAPGGGAVSGNPTTSIGLAIVNGAAATFMRSDGAPALSQAITPTWTAAHTFSAAVALNGTLSGTGLTAYLASPPAIGGSAPAAGSFTTIGGTTITASTQFTGPGTGITYNQGLTGSGTRTVLSRLKESVSVLDFFANGVSGAMVDPTGVTDSTAGIQAAINVGGTIYIPPGSYKISSTLTITAGFTAVIGAESLPSILMYGNAPAFKIGNTGVTLNEFSSIENLRVWNYFGTPSYTTPSPTNCGIAVVGTGTGAAVQRAYVHSVRILGFGCGMYLNNTVNTRLDRIVVENYVVWTGAFTTANSYIGFYFDGTPFAVGGISPQASILCTNLIVNAGFAPSPVRGYGFYIYGSDIRDIFLTDCETAGGYDGFWIQNPGSAYGWDVHINRPIVDGPSNIGIYIETVTGDSTVTINGGYCAPAGGAVAAIWMNNSSGIVVTGGFHFVGMNGVDNVRLFGSESCSVTNCSFLDAIYGISFDGSNYCVASGNIFNASTVTTSPTITDAIRLFNNSSHNTVANNCIEGASGAHPYSVGILLTAGATGNVLVGNQIDATTVTTPVSDSGTGTIQVSATGYLANTAKLTPVTVAALPAAATAGAGAKYHVSDALAPVFGANVAGAGAVSVPVYSDGANWKVG